jgi:hypothetical protein
MTNRLHTIQLGLWQPIDRSNVLPKKDQQQRDQYHGDTCSPNDRAHRRNAGQQQQSTLLLLLLLLKNQRQKLFFFNHIAGFVVVVKNETHQHGSCCNRSQCSNSVSPTPHARMLNSPVHSVRKTVLLLSSCANDGGECMRRLIGPLRLQ